LFYSRSGEHFRRGLGRRPDWVDDDLFPFESRFVEIDGHRVHYIDEGSGPTLLMLHGNPTWSFVYRDVIADLAADFRCVACDYPGFGLSTAAPGYRLRPQDHAEVVAGFIDKLHLDPYTLVAQDWGGPIGLYAAGLAPGCLAGLIVANTWAWPVNGDLHFEAFSRLMGGPPGRLAIRQLNVFVEVMMPLGHRRRKLSGGEMAHYRAPLSTPARRQASAVLPHAISTFLAEVLTGLDRFVDRPALVVWADRDIAFREKERKRWEALLPLADTAIVKGAGHYLQSDAPGDVADAIRSWSAR
jgi:haloalkane dehalogenase